MDTYTIKLLAFGFMVIDHIGVIFFPKLLILRWIGRLSFPLFSFLVIQGVLHTKSFKKYVARLLFWAVVSQPFFWLAFGFKGLNILFTLALSAVSLTVPLHWRFTLAVFAFFMRVDYGAYGVLLTQLLIPSQFSWLGWVALNVSASVPGSPLFCHSWQFLATLALPIIWNYNGLLGVKTKIFYLLYPAHLLALRLLFYGLIADTAIK